MIRILNDKTFYFVQHTIKLNSKRFYDKPNLKKTKCNHTNDHRLLGNNLNKLKCKIKIFLAAQYSFCFCTQAKPYFTLYSIQKT